MRLHPLRARALAHRSGAPESIPLFGYFYYFDIPHVLHARARYCSNRVINDRAMADSHRERVARLLAVETGRTPGAGGSTTRRCRTNHFGDAGLSAEPAARGDAEREKLAVDSRPETHLYLSNCAAAVDLQGGSILMPYRRSIY